MTLFWGYRSLMFTSLFHIGDCDSVLGYRSLMFTSLFHIGDSDSVLGV